MGLDLGAIARGVGKSFASTGQDADGKTNPYAGVGQAAAKGVFGMLAAKGESDDRNKLMAQQTAQNRDSNLSSLQQSIMGDTLTRDKLYSDRNPLGSQQRYMQKQMLRDIMLQKFMAPPPPPINAKVAERLKGSGYTPFTPQLRAGWEEGPSMFGKEMSLNALGQGDQVNSLLSQGRAPQTNFSRVYGDSPQTRAMQDEAEKYNQYQTGMRQQGQEKWLADAVDQRNAAAAQPQQKKGNIFSKILKGAGGVASFIPGIGQIVAPALTFAGGMAGGEGWKKSALGAGMAAIPFGLGKLGGAIGGTAGNILGKVANPLSKGVGKVNNVQNAITSGVGAFGQTFQPQGGGFMGGQPQQGPPQFQNQFAPQGGGFQPMNPRFNG